MHNFAPSRSLRLTLTLISRRFCEQERHSAEAGEAGEDKAGHVHGETDEWGHHAVKDIVHHYDWHATLLHCFGLGHTQLSYKRNGTSATLTDGQAAQVVKGLLA